jgi:hypothetical protein
VTEVSQGNYSAQVRAVNKSGPGAWSPASPNGYVDQPAPFITYCKGQTGVVADDNGNAWDSGSIRHDGVQYYNMPAGQYRIWTSLSHNPYTIAGGNGSRSITSWQSTGAVTIHMESVATGALYTASGDAASAPLCN